MENFCEKICRCIVHTGGCPRTPSCCPQALRKKLAPLPFVITLATPWLYLGYPLVLLGWLWYSFGIAYVLHTGNAHTLAYPNATPLITLHTLVSSLAIPWYNFLGSDLIVFITHYNINWTYPFGLTGAILFSLVVLFSCAYLYSSTATRNNRTR